MQQGDFTHFEIPADDPGRAKAFYSGLFGWSFSDPIPGFDDYCLFTTPVGQEGMGGAIGKRGQNVRLAARLTGWDVDIITPPEFQAGVQRLDQTLKQIEGITQEMVDKVVALGLIDVRDIEEVGAGPLMEELGLDEETAERVIERCSEEAKIVAVELVEVGSPFWCW